MALKAEKPAIPQNTPPKESGDDGSLEWFMQNENKKYDQQGAFAALPTFDARELLKKTQETLHQYRVLISREHREPGTRTNISQIETIYPWLLQQEGLIDGLEQRKWKGDAGDRAALYGSKLHEADVVFSLVIQRGFGRPGLPVEQIVPTEKNKAKLKLYDGVTRYLQPGRIRDQHDLETRLLLAWSNYHMLSEPEGVQMTKQDNIYSLPLPQMGLPDPEEKRELWRSEEMLEIGSRMAQAVAQQCFSEYPLTWEFRHDTLSQREIMVSLNFSAARLSINQKLDSVTRLWNAGSKFVEAQSVNLKTGSQRAHEGLEAEIHRRQKQLEQIGTEHFLSKYMRGGKNKKIQSLEPLVGGGAFHAKINHNNTRISRRTNFVGNRWFNQGTGEFELEAFNMTPEEREEFFTWLVWYGDLVNHYKPQIKKLVAQKISWDLRAVTGRF